MGTDGTDANAADAAAFEIDNQGVLTFKGGKGTNYEARPR